jgi:hypothetical protein
MEILICTEKNLIPITLLIILLQHCILKTEEIITNQQHNYQYQQSSFQQPSVFGNTNKSQYQGPK